MIKKFLILSLLLIPLLVSAEGMADKQIPKAEYLFHLYYDNGQLLADRDFQFKYDIIAEEFIQGPSTTQFPYRGEIINFAGEVANHFVFDPKHGDVKFTKGKISVKAPYVADGQKVIFYDNQNQPVLTIPVSDSSFCNDDGICNDDRGEDSLSCPKDCKQTLPAPPVTTPTTTPSSSSGLWSGILYTILGILLVGLVWWLFKRRHDQNTLPPLPPSSVPLQSGGPTLPTPPAPSTPNNSV